MTTPTVETPIPPVPSAQTLDNKGAIVSQPWQQWFVNLRDKVNQINGVVIAISGSGTTLGAFNTLSPLTTAGDMLTYGSGNNIRLPIGSTGQILAVVSGMPAWVNPSAGSTPLTTKGDIYGYNTAPARIPVGTDSYVLTADSTNALGVSWKPAGTPTLPVTTKGDLLGFDTAANRVPIGADGYILIADSTVPLGLKWGPAPAASPLTTKGDLYGYSTINARIPVGTDGQVLTADSTVAAGVSWKASGGGSMSFGYGKPSTLISPGTTYVNAQESPSLFYLEINGTSTPGLLASSAVNFSSTATATLNLANGPYSARLIFLVCHETSTSGTITVSSITAPSPITAPTSYTSFVTPTGFVYCSLWTATVASSTSGSPIVVTLSAATDDAIFIAIQVDSLLSPFLDVGSTGLPLGLTLSGTVTTTSFTVPKGGYIMVIGVTDGSGTFINLPAGFTRFASYANTGGARYCYVSVDVLRCDTAFSGTLSLTGPTTSMAIVTSLSPGTGDHWVSVRG